MWRDEGDCGQRGGSTQTSLRLITLKTKKNNEDTSGDTLTVTRTVVPRAEVIATSQAAPTNVDGQSGYFQLEATVYGRKGQPCRVCATPIRMLRQGQRIVFDRRGHMYIQPT